MKVIFLQNSLIKGRRFLAGDGADLDEAFAKHLASLNLVHAETPVEVVQETVAEVEQPKRRTTRRKAVQK